MTEQHPEVVLKEISSGSKHCGPVIRDPQALSATMAAGGSNQPLSRARHMTSITDVLSLEYGIAPPHYRLPNETRLGRVAPPGRRPRRSLAYYRAWYGLRVVLEEGEWFVVLGAQGDGRPLVELRQLPGARPVPRRGRLGLYHFAILLPDRAALGRFLGPPRGDRRLCRACRITS